MSVTLVEAGQAPGTLGTGIQYVDTYRVIRRYFKGITTRYMRKA